MMGLMQCIALSRDLALGNIMGLEPREEVYSSESDMALYPLGQLVYLPNTIGKLHVLAVNSSHRAHDPSNTYANRTDDSSKNLCLQQS